MAQEQVCHEIERWCASMADMVQTVPLAISQPIPLAETMHIALREMLRLTELQCGSAFLLDKQESVLRLVAHEALPERNRLAREMHDSLSQLLGYLNLKAASAEQLLLKGQIAEAHDDLLEVKRIAQAAYADTRETIFSLRAATTETGFLPALRNHLDDYQTFYGLRTDLDIEDASLAELPADVGIQVLCIIQEALTNVRKHAAATRVWIRFEPHGPEVQITIQDNGRGFDSEQATTISGPSFGLSIMRERAESVGGRVEVKSEVGKGAQVLVWAPRSKVE